MRRVNAAISSGACPKSIIRKSLPQAVAFIKGMESMSALIQLTEHVNDPRRDARLVHPLVRLIPQRQGLSRLHHFNTGAPINLEVRLVGPQNIHGRRAGLEIGCEDLD